MERKLYETPILYENLKKSLFDAINNAANTSGLMMCEIEPIVKDIYSQVQYYAKIELENAYKLREAENQAQESVQAQSDDNSQQHTENSYDLP